MDIKKSMKAKAEPITSPPPPQPVKQMLWSASALVVPAAPIVDSATTAQKQPDKKALLAQTRVLMDKQGFLKQEECITVSSLYNTFKLMDNRFKPKLPAEAQKLMLTFNVTDPSMTIACKVGPGLQDLQKWGRRILAEKRAKEAKENMWIGRMVVAKRITELDGLIGSHAA